MRLLGGTAMDNLELLKLGLMSVGCFFSLRSFYILKNSKRTKLSILSNFTYSQESYLKICVTNFGEKPVTIHSIRLPFMAWRKPANYTTPKFFKVISVIEDFLGKPDTYQYMSDLVINYSINDSNMALSEGNQLIGIIPLEKLIYSYFETDDAMPSKLFFFFFIFFLNINVKLTNGKIFKVRACREVRYYLYKKYLNDERIYGRAR